MALYLPVIMLQEHKKTSTKGQQQTREQKAYLWSQTAAIGQGVLGSACLPLARHDKPQKLNLTFRGDPSAGHYLTALKAKG